MTEISYRWMEPNEVNRIGEIDRSEHIRIGYTSSGSAVGFYLSQGFRPADTPIPELYALEPEDIHMLRPL